MATYINEITRVSTAYDNQLIQGNGASFSSSISADGRYVAFISEASNLVPGDTGGRDVFVRDLQTGAITRVTNDGNISQADFASISADGRYVVFSSFSDLVPGDTGGQDVFVRDLQTGATTRVTPDANRDGGYVYNGDASISADGRYVAFVSGNLVPGNTNGTDVFVRDLQTGTITRVSTDANGNQGNAGSNNVSISADGRYVAFDSSASNLVPGDTNGATDVFVRDLQTGTITRVSTGTSQYLKPSISADGRYVAFISEASNLVPGDTNGATDVFVRDLQTGATTRVSSDANGNAGNAYSGEPSISADGRYVAFASDASNLVPGDTNGRDVFVRDLQTGTIARVSTSANGEQGSGSCVDPHISADGRYVTFYSNASNLVPGDTNFTSDVFVVPNSLANHPPIVTSNGGGDTARVSIAENTTAVTTVTATDPDAGQTLSYSIVGGADASKFTLGFSTGALSFITAPNFEVPTDADHNNVYLVNVQASDGHGGIDTQAIAVTITDVIENGPPPPPGTTAVMILRHGADGQYEIYNIGNNTILAACWLKQVGTDWQFAGLGDFNSAHTSDMLLRNSKTGGFEVYNIANNNVVSTSLVGTVGLEWKTGGFGDFNGDGSTDMMLQNVNSGGLEAYNIAHNAITGAAYMGVTGLDWKIAGFGDFFSRGHDDMLMRNVNNGGIYAYDISGNRINSATYMGIVGTDWQVMAFGNFSSRGTDDMIMRNTGTGGLEVYNLDHGQITGAAFLGTVGLDWQYAGVAPVGSAGETDLVLRNVNSGQFEVYDIGHDQITGATLLGTVGLDWAVDAVAPNPAAFTGAAGGGGGPVADAATTQLTQAMASFGGGAADTSVIAPLSADTSQQTFLTTPHA